ncbi:MAG: hypothetical protein KA714_04270 [Limnoraphis sp. WC205]|nr:hypothetical protein [Limnoraphis sp. WC205]
MGWRSVTHQNLLKFVNGQKWAKMGKNGQKWAKMGKNGQKWAQALRPYG